MPTSSHDAAAPDDRPADRATRGSRPDGVDLARAEAAVRELLIAVGEDPDREGLKRTPARVARAYAEMFAGLFTDPDDGAARRRSTRITTNSCWSRTSRCTRSASTICCRGTGQAAVGYIPGDDGRITGLSKLARVVDLYATPARRSRSG